MINLQATNISRMAALRTIGRIFFGLALAGFGLTQLITADFSKDITPFTYLPLQIFWVYVTGVVMLVASCLFITGRFITLASIVAGLLFLVYFLSAHLPRLIATPADPRVLTVAFETLALSCGAFLIGAGETEVKGPSSKMISFLKSAGLVSRYLLAVCLIVFGIQHFMYADFIQTLMPEWLPGKVFFSYMVRFGLILAAITLLINVQVRLGMLMLGFMFFCWVAMLHTPRAIVQPGVVAEWTSLCIAMALSGIGLHIAGTPLNRAGIMK